MGSTGQLVRIAAIQQGPRTEDVESNLNDLLMSIDKAAIGGADYIVATELSLTPYFCLRKAAPNTGNGR